MKTSRLILLVDDDADDRVFFDSAVREIDPSVKCITSSNGVKALEFLKQTSLLPDYIFLDLNMPRTNGKECLREIRRIPRLAGIPVIIYATAISDSDRGELTELGASCFLQKPFRFEHIIEEISSVLSGDLKRISHMAS